jgi:hypothetical protein
VKKTISLSLVLFFTLNSIGFAATNVMVIDQKVTSFEYEEHMYKISHILRVNEGDLISTSEKLPHDTQEAHELFEKVCAPKSSTADLAKRVTVSYNGLLITNEFQCDERSEISDEISTVQFVVTVDRENNLKDLQINQLSAKAKSTTINPHKLTFNDGGEIAIAVAASILASGLLAKQVYAGQQDKFLHAEAGSLIASAATLLAYYGFKVSKNEAALIGFATAVAVGLLKEYAYDVNRKHIHTVDIHDARATSMGGASGALFIRLKFQWK